MIGGEPLAVAVIVGGPSSEANVSRSSGAGVRAALLAAGHHAELLELDRDLIEILQRERFDVAFPTTHGPVGEDGCLQGLLEVLDMPYVGSGVLASALAMSKPHAKVMFRAAGLPLADELLIDRGDDLRHAAGRVRERLGEAVVIKPAAGGSAIGVARIDAGASERELVSALQAALELGGDVLVERFVAGAEVTCGVIDDEGGAAVPLPPTLILSKAAEWYDFESRYAAGGSEHLCPAPLARDLTLRVQDVAARAHRALGCRDLSRVDFVVREGPADEAVTLLEVNTLPGMTATSLFPEAAAAHGIPFSVLCDRLARRAQGRPRRARPRALPMP
jgi:D-alanine-D-alanine ligase